METVADGCHTGRVRRGWLVLAVLVALGLACAGLSWFTSGLQLQNLSAVAEVVAVVDGGPGAVVVYTERRGTVRSWEVDDSGEIVHGNQPDQVRGTPRTEDCAAGICYRVATTALRVEASRDGGQTYATAWELDGETSARLARSYPDVGDPATHLSSRSLVVHEVSTGHVVFVANGRDGLLRRDADGTWHRLGSPASGEGCCYYEPALRIATDPPPLLDLTPYAVGVSVGAVLLTGLMTAMLRRRWPWRRLLAVVVLAGAAGYGTERSGHFPTVGMFPGWLYGVPIVVLIMVGGCGLAWLFVADRPRPRSEVRIPVQNRTN